MKLLVVSHACITPVNRQLYEEFRRLTDWDVDLLVPSNWRDEYGRTPGLVHDQAFGGRLIGMPVWKPGDIILHAYRGSLRRLLRESNPDVIYVNHEPYAVGTAQVYWANARSLRRPIGFYSCQNIFKRYPPPFCWTEGAVLRSSAFACPISPAVNDVFRRKGYAGPSMVVPLGIDGGVYRRPDDDAVSAARLHMARGEDSGRTLLAFVGRLVPEKGLATLIDALAISAKSTDVVLALIGRGPMEAELRWRAESAGVADRVTFADYVPHAEVPAYLAAADVLVLPSETQGNWKEQFGRVLLEAMFCGTPVIGSNSGEIPTLISDTGGGLIFRERDTDDLARQIVRLAHDVGLRGTLAAAGAASVAARYNLASIAQSFAQTILAVASEFQPALARAVSL